MRTMPVFPYNGRNYLCGDTITAEDVWQILDAFTHVRTRGECIANATAKECNLGNVQVVGPQPSRKIQVPVSGMLQSLLFWPLIPWRNWFPFELNPNFNSIAIEATIRLLSQSEYNTIEPLQSGDGYKGQFISILVVNSDNGGLQTLATIYKDPVWYAANIGALAANPISYDSLQGDGAKLLSLIVGLNGTLFTAGKAQPAYIYINTSFPRRVNGSAWGTMTTQSTAFLPATTHPATGIEIQGAGVIDFQAFQFFNTAHSVTPSGNSGGLVGSRSVDLFSVANYPPMGEVLNGTLWSRIRNDYRAARSIGFTAFVQSGHNIGSIGFPLVGDKGIIVNEQASQQFTTYIEIPANAKRVVVVGMVRANAQGGMTQTLTVLLQKPLAVGLTNQNILTVTSTNTSPRIVYNNVALGGIAPLDADSVTERAELIVTSTKVNPRAGTVGNGGNVNDPQFQYWDGVFALYVKFC